jgi:hypothetical protein
MPVILTRENENDWINGHAVMEFAHPKLELVATAI